MDFESDIGLVFHAVVGRDELHVPVLREVLGGASQQIMQIHVGGTLQNPETTRVAFPASTRPCSNCKTTCKAVACRGPRRKPNKRSRASWDPPEMKGTLTSMSVGPLGGVAGSVAGSPLAQTKGSEPNGPSKTPVQQRRVETDRRAEAAAGIGETDGEDHETDERDADGRRSGKPRPSRKTRKPSRKTTTPPGSRKQRRLRPKRQPARSQRLRQIGRPASVASRQTNVATVALSRLQIQSP